MCRPWNGRPDVRALSRGPRVSKSGSERVRWLSLWKVNWRRPETGGRKTSEEAVTMARSRQGSGHLESHRHDRTEYMSSATCFGPPWSHHRRRALGGHFPAMCPQRAPPSFHGSTQQCWAPVPSKTPLCASSVLPLELEPAQVWPRCSHLSLNWVGPMTPSSTVSLV